MIGRFNEPALRRHKTVCRESPERTGTSKPLRELLTLLQQHRATNSLSLVSNDRRPPTRADRQKAYKTSAPQYGSVRRGFGRDTNNRFLMLRPVYSTLVSEGSG